MDEPWVCRVADLPAERYALLDPDFARAIEEEGAGMTALDYVRANGVRCIPRVLHQRGHGPWESGQDCRLPDRLVRVAVRADLRAGPASATCRVA